MPFLKMYISGELVDTMPISFEGLRDAAERLAHVEGLMQYMKNNNYVNRGLSYEIFLDEVESYANKIIRLETINDEVVKKVDTRNVKYSPRRNIVKKEYAVRPEEIKPIVRPKGVYSNKQWLDD